MQKRKFQIGRAMTRIALYGVLATAIVLPVHAQFPPAPGQIPDHPLLVGPAASRYMELLRIENKWVVAKAQLAALAAQADYVAGIHAVPVLDAGSLGRLGMALVKAVRELQVQTAAYLAKYGYPAACMVTLAQDALCPPAPSPTATPEPAPAN